MSLKQLRADPLNACLTNVYRTGPGRDAFNGAGALVEGGPCVIDAKEVQAGFYDLKAVPTGYTGSDYFYPWLRTGVGFVKVPKNGPDGTIVMTGGVNGCSIVVNELGSDFYFYHDGDSKFLGTVATVGTGVAKVTPRDYDPFDMGNKAFSAALASAAKAKVKPTGDVSYGHFVVAVKVAGRFGFYSTGVMSLNGLAKLPVGLTTCIVKFG